MTYIKYIIYMIISIILLYFIIKYLFPNKSDINIFTIFTLSFQIVIIIKFILDRIDIEKNNIIKSIDNYIKQNEKIWIDTENIFLNYTNKDYQILELYKSMFIYNDIKITDINNKKYYDNKFNTLNINTIHISSIILQNIENILLNLDNINRLNYNLIYNNNKYKDITENIYIILKKWINNEIILSVWIKYINMFSNILNKIIIRIINNDIKNYEDLNIYINKLN